MVDFCTNVSYSVNNFRRDYKEQYVANHLDYPSKNWTGKIVNGKELCEIYGFPSRTLHEYNKHEPPPPRVPLPGKKINGYNTKEFLRWYITCMVRDRESVDTHGKGGKPQKKLINPNLEKALLSRAQREGQEIKNKITMGELVKSNDALMVMTKIFTAARNKLMSIRPKLKTRLPELDDKQINIIDALITNACNELPDEIEESILNESIFKQLSNDDEEGDTELEDTTKTAS